MRHRGVYHRQQLVVLARVVEVHAVSYVDYLYHCALDFVQFVDGEFKLYVIFLPLEIKRSGFGVLLIAQTENLLLQGLFVLPLQEFQQT